MKRLLTTTATALVFATGAYAANETSSLLDYDVDVTTEVHASDFIGMRVYATLAEFDASVPVANSGETEWDDIGKINDVILTREGSVGAVLVGVGSFLGLGEKPVAVTFDELNIQRSEDGGEFRVYIDATEESLESQPEYTG